MNSNTNDTIPSELYKHWIHSFEEDDASLEYTVYRPSSFSFPPARGRAGFEIKPKGIVISHPIAPADGNMSIKEKWRFTNGELTFTGNLTSNKYKIISVSKDKLVLKPVESK